MAEERIYYPFHPRCGYAFEPCSTEEPLLRANEGETDRAVACWLHVRPNSAPTELSLVPAGERR